MGYLLYSLIAIVLLFIFPGIISLIPALLGFIFNFMFMPIELVAFNIYPVGSFVYIAYTALFVYLVYEYIHHHIMNK